MLTDKSLTVWMTCILMGLCLPPRASCADEPKLPEGVSSWQELGSLPTAMPVITMWNGGISMAGVDPYLLYAVWEDGTVMVCTPQPSPAGMKERSAWLAVGRVDPERVQALLKECEQAGVFDPAARRTFLGVDGPRLRIAIRYKGRQRVMDYHGRNEWEKRENYGPNANPSWPEVQAFIKLWRQVEGGIQALTPTPRVGYNGPRPLQLPMAADILGPLPIEAARRVRDVLPKGWTLTMTGGGFEVRRREPIEWFNSVNLPSHDKEELKARGFVRTAAYTIRASIAPPLSPERLAEMKQANENTRLQMAELDGKMAHIRGKGDYLPNTPADHALVDQYKKLKASLHRLPDVNSAKWSVYLRASLTGYQAFYSQQVEQECTALRKAIETALAAAGKAEAPERTEAQ
ncbi:hypothetical protein LCGC14_0226460 [marine sediment metagenome]|uniref:Uncharacterized protein n=1 Tax=marine sediment metagenome TaxID=412755 RepID=A0A0F9XFR7_9ZZZZ|nr:hypothetical protein [Phycisphaerae bacterium]HDZ44515.1 hypothetical protein [Phycisphaerae bacterium]